MEVNNKEDKYYRARERVVVLKKFYTKILRGLLAVSIVGAINYYLNEWERPWFLWVVFGVSLSILIRAFKIYNLNPFFGRDWEGRKIKELIDNKEV